MGQKTQLLSVSVSLERCDLPICLESELLSSKWGYESLEGVCVCFVAARVALCLHLS